MKVDWSDIFTVAETGADIWQDTQLQKSNQQALNSWDMLEVAKQLGATEEHYRTEIAIVDAVTSLKNKFFPTKTSPMEMFLLKQMGFDTYEDFKQAQNVLYRSELQQRMNDTPLYATLKYGGKGLKWMLEKSADETQSRPESQQGNQWG